ncbi:MAG: glycosyltransferase family 4 protein [Acidobacteriaceae bacterium]
MRVLMTTDTIGGVWTFTRHLATEFLRRGHKVALVSFGRGPSVSQLAWCDKQRALHAGGFSYFASEAPLEWMPDNDQAYAAGAPALLSIASEFAPDVLLTSQFCFAAVPLLMPKVVVAHSDVLSWGRACRGEQLPMTKWLRQYTDLVSAGLQAATAVIAPTQWMLSALADTFTLPSGGVVISNGVNIVDDMANRPRKHQAVTAGRFWDEAKNLQLLQSVELPLPLVIAGDCATDSSFFLSERSNVVSVGELPEDELHDLFRASDIYLCTSIYEPFGLAPLEAALCGCVVLANDIPSLREVWGDSAMFFSDAASLKSSLQDLESPVRLRAWQQRCTKRAQTFSADRMAQEYLNLMEGLTFSKARRSRSAANAA